MKSTRDIGKVKKAMLELKYASMHLGDIRPSSELESDEFFELVEIKQEIETLYQRMKTITEKGNKQ